MSQITVGKTFSTSFQFTKHSNPNIWLYVLFRTVPFIYYKQKYCHCVNHKGIWRECLQIYTFLTSEIDGSEFHAEAALTPKKGELLLIENCSCVGPRTGFGEENFSRHFLESNHGYSDIQL